MKKVSLSVTLLFIVIGTLNAQVDSTKIRQRKNIIRYNLSGALLFGPDKYLVLGYERVLGKRQSISVNFGATALPKFVSIETDSFSLSKDLKNNGNNFSIDYRFYPRKENKYLAPHGLYLGPYYAFNHFNRENRWEHQNSTTNNNVTTRSVFNIHTVGFQLGYQFIFWKRVALDLVLIGPGLGFYRYKVKFDGTIDEETRAQLIDGLEQLLTQKFPGMNYVLSDEQIDANGVLSTNSVGFRYLIQIGINF